MSTAIAAVMPHPFAGGESWSRTVTLDAASIRQFATLAGDDNPLHHDDAAAAAGPFGTLIASATQVLALLMGLDAASLSRHGLALGLGFAFKLQRAVPAGATVEFVWTVRDCVYKPSLQGYVVELDGVVRDSVNATVYVTAQGTNLLRPSPGESTG
ncbi:MAG: MaoC family dehydratase [Proteobacteria bacterium]|nr:MaoC family dehydratase [Pseudomonadota bacterium]